MTFSLCIEMMSIQSLDSFSLSSVRKLEISILLKEKISAWNITLCNLFRVIKLSTMYYI